jgi:hypothetical protein
MVNLFNFITLSPFKVRLKIQLFFVIKKAASLRLSPLIYRLFTVGIA